MESILTAAFLVFVGSQADCPPPCGFGGDCMPTDFGTFSTITLTPALGERRDILAVRDRAALKDTIQSYWLGERCSGYENSVEVYALDVKAGRWLKIKQARETRKTREVVEKEERTGNLKVQIE